MNLERSTSSVMVTPMIAVPAVALAAALTGSGASAQVLPECDSGSAGTAVAARVVDGRSFVLADGREIRLAAIETVLPVPGDEDEMRVAASLAAKAALEALVLGREISLSPAGAGPDRYGRVMAYVSARLQSGEILVQRELVAAGQAVVAAIPATPCSAALRTVEREARASRLGVWGASYSVVKKAADLADLLADQGRFAIVQGRVVSVRERAGIVYINFGRRGPDQFTATLLKRNERAFAGAPVALKALPGRMVEVRGWIEERNGPAMEVTRPEQIDIID